MKKIYFLSLLVFVSAMHLGATAQATIDFEPGGKGAAYTWNVFENSDNPVLEVVANPNLSGINTSATVAKFTARVAGQPYAGVECAHGNFGPLTFSSSNSTVKIMVFKSVISDVGLKFAESNGEAQPEVKVANTKINEWEELTFDLSGNIGKGLTKVIDQIIVFPDFKSRAQENIVYFDNITFSGQGTTGPDASLSALLVDGQPLAGFSSSNLSYVVELPENTTVVPTVTATTNDVAATAVVTPATSIPGTTTVVVTAADGTTISTYSIDFKNEVTVISLPSIDFESGGLGADFSWNVFENSDNPSLSVEANPNASGINTSSKVAKFTARSSGQPYAGVESAHGNIGPFTFDATNTIVKIMVYKTLISDVGLKFAEANGEAQPEVKVPNTKINEWEELTFDLSGSIGKGVTGIIDQIILFPDFKARTEENIVYFDNITFSGKDTGGSNDEYVLVWSDEFNSDGAIDGDNWFHQTQLPQGGGWYNGEEQHYTNRIENSFASGGFLNIVAKKESFTDQGQTKQYTSARLNSKYAFTYGRVDVRAKLPSGNGTWPAIWALGQNIMEPGGYWSEQYGTIGWPGSGEIDIMEHWGNNPNVIHGSIHTTSSSGGTINTGTTVISDVSNTYHVYSMIWDENAIEFLVDDVSFYTYNPSTKDDSTWPFDKPQYLLLNIAMGGIGGAIDPSFTSSTMAIDYVRVYQKDPEEQTATEPVVAAPIPTINQSEVLSVFSDSYTNVSGTNFNPNWNQSTVVTEIAIAGNNTLKYDGLNYQGIELGSAQDVSTYSSIHIDYWTANSTALNVFLISTGPNEDPFAFDIIKNEWISIDIPLTEFASPVALNDIIQLKFDGNGTVYLDNIYFSGQSGNGGGETGSTVSLPFDFETTPVTIDFVDFDGGVATVIDNPHADANNPSGKVAQIVRNGGAMWGGSKLILKEKIDFSVNNAFQMKVYSSRSDVPMLFKLEGPNAAKEVEVKTTVANAWETMIWDFTDTPSGTYDEVVFIFDFGTVGDGSANSTFLFDDVELIDNTGGLSKLNLPVMFEDETINHTMSDFGGNSTIVGIDPTNANNHVGITTKTMGAETWAGTTMGTNLGFASKIPFTASETKISMNVYSPAAGITLRLKVEDHKNNELTAETDAVTTIANGWENITFDFSNVATGTNPFNLSTNFDMLSVFFNFGNVGGDQVFYWDNVMFGEGAEIIVEPTLGLLDLQNVRIFANEGQLNIIGADQLINASVDVFNLSGQRIISTILTDAETRIAIPADGVLIVRIIDNSEKTITVRKLLFD